MEKYWIFYMPAHIVKTSSLSLTARILLDVFLLGMRAEDNLVCFVDGGMEMYLEFYKSKLNRPITEKTIRNATTELVRCGLLKKLRNGIYTIDKIFFVKIDFRKEHLDRGMRYTRSIDSEIEAVKSSSIKNDNNEEESNDFN